MEQPHLVISECKILYLEQWLHQMTAMMASQVASERPVAKARSIPALIQVRQDSADSFEVLVVVEMDIGE
tara:strand:- start:14980 stop:15189 length:210 start_codon:yes stop_codon:yes gene_type:complete